MKVGVVLCYGVFEETNQEYKDYLEWISKDIEQLKLEKVIVCGGTTNNLKPDLSEAVSAINYLKKIFPTYQNFIPESQSLTTTQNLENASKLVSKDDELTIYCDLTRMAKIIWMSLHFFFGLSKEEISLKIFDFIKDRKIKPFIYKNLHIKPFDFPSRDKYQATAQSFSTLLEVEAIYDLKLDREIIDQRKKDFGIRS